MDKQAKTYQTPAGALLGDPERPGALYYGTITQQVPHEVAVIAEEPDDGGWLLVSGPSFYGRIRPAAFLRDPEPAPAPS